MLNENTDSNTNVVLPPYFDTSIHTQRNNASDALLGTNDVASELTIVVIQIARRMMIHSHMRHKQIRSYSFGDKISTTTTP